MTSLFEKDILYLNCYKGQKGTNQMKCPYCNNPDTRVIDSRPAEDGSCIRRRRSCDICGKRFTTYEKVETIPLTVIKKDNTREQYDRRKVENGVVRACYKRPVATADIQKVVDRIETKVFSMEEKEIPSSAIGVGPRPQGRVGYGHGQPGAMGHAESLARCGRSPDGGGRSGVPPDTLGEIQTGAFRR